MIQIVSTPAGVNLVSCQVGNFNLASATPYRALPMTGEGYKLNQFH
jgi:hypothetical protein